MATFSVTRNVLLFAYDQNINDKEFILFYGVNTNSNLPRWLIATADQFLMAWNAFAYFLSDLLTHIIMETWFQDSEGHYLNCALSQM